MSRLLIAMVAVVCLLIATPATARIAKIEITNTSDPDPDGYVTITGTAYGEVDPMHPLNAIIQDIELAPRNERGMVEYSMDVTILKPPGGGSGILYYEVVNRGLMLNRIFNEFETQSRKRGYSIVWSGWQGDLAESPGAMNLRAPVATRDGAEITGRVRTARMVSAPSSMVEIPYEPADLSGTGAVLTRRRLMYDPKEEISNEDWAFANCADAGFPGTPSPGHICMKEAFDPAYIYEIIYTAKNPLVLGLGFAATRDLVSFLRHAAADDSGTPNPLGENIQSAIMHGVSQSGRFIRTYLHLGFNQDEDRRIVFEGMNPCIGTARLGLNVRFAQPSQDYGVSPLIPGFENPFTWMPQYDPVAGRVGWLFERCLETNSCPKVVEMASSMEYWGGRASLSTTDALGQHDLWLPRNVRMYLIAGTPHAPAARPSLGACQHLSNANNYRPYWRALLVALERWVLRGEEPPESQIPTLLSDTLGPHDTASFGWPAIPGSRYLELISRLPLVDYGLKYNPEDASGILSEPPEIDPDNEYTLLVPQIDADGNEIAGIRPTTVQAPIATYAGWNLLHEKFGIDRGCGINGSFIPFAITKAEREAAGDPRLSLEERYGDHEGYVDAVREAASRLVAQRFLLPEDAAAIVQEAEDSDVLVLPETENEAPVAVITPVGQTVASMQAALDGSKSWDPDGDPITYSWRTTGMAALILGAGTATPSVQFQSGAGSYTFELAVTDGKGASGTATTTVVYMGQ